MSDKLTVWTAAKEVSTAVGTMVNTYKTLRTVKKQESIILKEKIPDDCKGKGNGRSSASEY